MTTRRNIFDYSHVKSVSAILLVDRSTRVSMGKIIANWSDNPNGSVCTAQVFLHIDSDKIVPKQRSVDLMGTPTLLDCPLIGKAGGGGYDKLSAAICYALRENTLELPPCTFDGCGMSAVSAWFLEHFDIELITVI